MVFEKDDDEEAGGERKRRIVSVGGIGGWVGLEWPNYLWPCWAGSRFMLRGGYCQRQLIIIIIIYRKYMLKNVNYYPFLLVFLLALCFHV